MARLITKLCGGSPRALLLFALSLTLLLSAYAIGVPDRLGLGGGDVADSASGEARAALADELGYDPEAAFVLVLTSEVPISGASSDVAVETLGTQLEAIDGVAAITEGAAPSDTGDVSAVTLSVHLALDADSETAADVGEVLGRGLDPGPFELLVGGSFETQQNARAVVLDEAPKLLAVVTPLLLLILIGALGLRPGLAALLGAGLASAASLALLGLIAEFTEIQVAAAITVTFVAALGALRSSSTLLFRYREESATLGPGLEALEYTLGAVLRGTGLGSLSVAIVGLALLAAPADFATSIGVGLIVAAAFAPVLGLLPLAAVIAQRPEAEVGAPLPLVPDDARVERAPRSFRLLLALGRRRRRAVLALLPLLIGAALVPALLDSEAIGLSAEELPGDESAARVATELTPTAAGVGQLGPLFAGTAGPGEAPTVTIYRDAIVRLPGVAAVGPAATADSSAVFDVSPASSPQSLDAQATAAELIELPSPSPRQVGGPPAAIADSGAALGDELPLLAAAALLAAALLWALLLRSAFAPLIAVSALLAPLAGLAAMVAVFGSSRLTDLLDYTGAGAAHLDSYVIVGAVLLALALARGADFATALRDERTLGGGAAGSLARSGTLSLTAVATATALGVALAAVWLGSDLVGAKEVGLGLAAGLLADLLLVRTLLAPALARLGL